MADAYNAVFLHLVWATLGRQPTMTEEVRAVIYKQIQAVSEELGCPAYAVGGIEDHIHVLVKFSTTITISELVKKLKGTSSRTVNYTFVADEAPFRWQGAYGVFPVTPNRLEQICNYIAKQEEHHAKNTLIDSLERIAQPEKHNSSSTKSNATPSPEEMG